MGHYVHIHVAFACDDHGEVATVAAKHLPAMIALANHDLTTPMEAVWFLEALSKRSGYDGGPKGGLSLWGLIGNYTRVDEFCEALRPFWEELLADLHSEGLPHDFEHVIVFEEQEQREAATAYEIFWDDDDSPDRKLQIISHERLPFAWMQF